MVLIDPKNLNSFLCLIGSFLILFGHKYSLVVIVIPFGGLESSI